MIVVVAQFPIPRVLFILSNIMQFTDDLLDGHLDMNSHYKPEASKDHEIGNYKIYEDILQDNPNSPNGDVYQSWRWIYSMNTHNYSDTDGQ